MKTKAKHYLPFILILIIGILSACSSVSTPAAEASPLPVAVAGDGVDVEETAVSIQIQSSPAAPTSTTYLPIIVTPVSATGERLQPSDLTYLGAFRLPGGEEPPLTFAYGGNAMTFNPDNNTLFITGHDRMAYGELPNGDQVAEVSIPTPAIAANPADLPQAVFVQDFHDVLAGQFTLMEEIPKVGLQYLNHPDTGGLLHVAWGQQLQSDIIPTHGWFSADLENPNFQGSWLIGNQDLYSTNGYMFDIPSDWADRFANGRYLATGRMRDGGQGGKGPALFAYTPWGSGGTAPPNGTHLNESTLLLYESVYDNPNIENAMDNYQHADEWEGGAWMRTSSGKTAVLFAGTKSNGVKYWYGYAHPDGAEYACVDNHVTDFLTCRMADGSSCPPEDFAGCCDEDAGTCITYRGWWSTHFDAEFIFYDPADLARVAAGEMESWEPQPYASMDIDEHLYLDPPEWDEVNLGTGDQRRYRINASAYDRENGFLYVLEQSADGAKPVVHVWQVAE